MAYGRRPSCSTPPCGSASPTGCRGRCPRSAIRKPRGEQLHFQKISDTMPRRLKRYRNQKGVTTMVAQNARTFLVVPNVEAENEVDKIKRTVEAPRILDSAIQNFKKERTKAREDFEKSLASAISGASFKVDDAIGSYNAWRATHDAL